MMTPEELTAKADEAPPAGGPPEPPRRSLKRALMNSAAWTVGGWAFMQVMKFASSLILTRVLFPEAFGLMALVFVFVTGLHMFSDVGIGPSVVHNKRGEDPAFYNTAWTVQILRGLVLWLISVAIAWPVASFYHDYDRPDLPSLAYLLPTVGLATAISGFDSTALFVLDRRLAQGRRVLLQVTALFITLGVTILLAWAFHSVWALVVGNLLSAVVEMAGSHFLVPDIRNRLHWDRTAAVDLLHFGKWVFLGTAFTFIGGQGDRLVIGKLSGLVLLGVYQVGASLTAIPSALLGSLASQVVFPAYARVLHGGRTVAEAYARVHPVFGGFAAYAVSGLVASGPTFIRIAYDPRYYEAGWIVQLLALGAWFSMLEVLIDAMLWGLGRANVTAFSNAAKALSLPVLMGLGYLAGGVEGLVVGFVATELVRYGVSAWYIRRQGAPVVRYDAALTLLIAVVSLVGLAAGALLWPDRPRAASLAVFGVDPSAGFPAGVPWGALAVGPRKDWGRLLPRFFTEAGVVTLLWGLIALVAWRLRIIRTTWKAEG
jgi:O-antigen/teichoic acid export membrane protein